MGAEPTTVDLSDVRRARADLQLLCDRGYVADIGLVDGSEVSAVLIGLSSTSLILDRWDSDHRRPAGDPFVMELSRISVLQVP
jgi:hypothetical protein